LKASALSENVATGGAEGLCTSPMLLVTCRDESVPPGRRVSDTSRHQRGRPLSCLWYIDVNIVAFHLWSRITHHFSAIMQSTVLFLALARYQTVSPGE
jgi:hypothetical protein